MTGRGGGRGRRGGSRGCGSLNRAGPATHTSTTQGTDENAFQTPSRDTQNLPVPQTHQQTRDQSSSPAVGSSHAAQSAQEPVPGATDPEPSEQVDEDIEDERASDGRIVIRMIGDTFRNQSRITKNIMEILKGRYEGAWPTWGNVPNHVQEMLWLEFTRIYMWDPKDSLAVRKQWSIRISKRISTEFCNARKGGYCPKWISQCYWDEMCRGVWATEKFHNKCAAAQKNRMEGGLMVSGLSTTGSISIVEHEERLKKAEGRPVFSDETFRVTHQHQKDTKTKKKGEWVDEKSARIYANFQEKLQQATQQASTSGSSIPGKVRERLFMDVVGGKSKKGRIWLELKM